MKRELKKRSRADLTILLAEGKQKEHELREELKEAREQLFKTSFNVKLIEEVLKEEAS